MSSQADSRDSHTTIPARPDLIRLGVGIMGIGTSGPLIAMSAMPIPTLIFWRNLGGSLLTLPFALKHPRDRTGIKWSILAGFILAIHFVGFFLAMRWTSEIAKSPVPGGKSMSKTSKSPQCASESSCSSTRCKSGPR